MSRADENCPETPLLAILRARIARDGPLPIDAYMRICLEHPEYGYWRRADTIGTSGDFITAPEISQVFGELIGLWCAVVWQSMGSPTPLRLVELGPGRGTLIRDALRSARAVPSFLSAITVHLVDTSGPLRAIQQQTLASFLRSREPTQATDLEQPSEPISNPVVSLSNHGDAPAAVLRQAQDEGSSRGRHPLPNPGGAGPGPHGDHISIEWHETLGQVPRGPAIVIANEFLDALPIGQLLYVDRAWRERVVDLDAHGALRFAVGAEVTGGTEELAVSPSAGSIVELSAGENELLAQLAARGSPLVALFIDYGPAQPATGDTLQAVRRHAWVHPLSQPGNTDLTAHVQFARLTGKARAAGLLADGPMTQAEFLGRLGFAERAARLMAANPAHAANIEAGVQRLISPTGMGELFKALAVRTRGVPPTIPFA